MSMEGGGGSTGTDEALGRLYVCVVVYSPIPGGSSPSFDGSVHSTSRINPTKARGKLDFVVETFNIFGNNIIRA